jgi:hypothetical protein
MCDFSAKLMAWLDQELSADDAASVERHLQLCSQCRDRVEAYRQVSGALEEYGDAYCQAVMPSSPPRKLPRRMLTFWEAAALTAAAMAALFLLAARARVHLSPVRAPAELTNAANASQPIQTAEAPQATDSAPAPIRPLPRLERENGAQIRHADSQPPSQETHWFPAEPAVEIAIPADAIFPPGAAPDDVGFTADVTIAPDGSAQQILLRPQLTEFERRSTRP